MISRTDIYNYIEGQLNTLAHPIYCTSEFTDKKPSFPCCYMQEVQRSMNTNVQFNFADSHRVVTWEIQIFSNKANGNMIEANYYMSLVEGIMRELHFVEESCLVTPNMDASIFRITARFTRVIGSSDTI